MSLNNRIYLREHQPSEYGDSATITVSNQVRATAPSSLIFAVPELQTQAPKGVIFPVYPISRSVNLDYSSTDLSPVRAIYLIPPFLNDSVYLQPHPNISLTPPEDLEWTAGASLHLNGRKDEIGG